jgi:hypothetical protein
MNRNKSSKECVSLSDHSGGWDRSMPEWKGIWSIYVYLYICLYLLYLFICTLIPVLNYIKLPVHIRIYVCVYVYSDHSGGRDRSVPKWKGMYTQNFLYVCIFYMYMRMHIYWYVHTYVYIYIYTYICIIWQAFLAGQFRVCIL